MKKLLIAASALLLTSSLALAQDLKIGMVDMQQIMQKSTQIKSANTDLEKQFKPRQDKLNAQQKDFQAAVEKFNREQAKMAPQDRTQAQNKLIADRDNLQKTAVSFQQDLANAKNSAMQKFSTRFSEVLNKLATSGSYDFILQKQTTPYVNEKYNVTNQVLDLLDKK